MGWPLRFDGALVRVEDLDGIVSAAAQRPDVVVGQVLHQLEQLRIFSEKFLADICAVMGAERLVFAVHAFMHALEQQAGGVAGQQIVPAGAPDHLITFQPAPRKAASSS